MENATTNSPIFYETTTRIHMNPKEALGSLEHVRSKDFRNREAHVDTYGGRFEVWKDESVYDVYDELFGDYIREYNKNQKTKCRRILDANGDGVGGYIEKIQTGKRGKKERAVYKNMPDGTKEVAGKREMSQGQRILYELVVSVGNCEKKRNDRGQIIYTDDGHEIHPMRLPYEVNKAAVKAFYEQFESFYPHFKLTTAAWHADEFYLNANSVKEYGIEHAHLCFVPWADGYQRGLPVQASVSKALEQMGFKNGKDEHGVYHNAYWYFTQDAQERFEDIVYCEYEKYQKAHGVTIGSEGFLAAMGCVPLLFFEHPAEGKNLPNLDPEQYRELKDVERQVNVAKEELNTVLDTLNEKSDELEWAEIKIADAKQMDKDLNDYIALKMQKADQYYADRKEEADTLVRDADEKYKERMKETQLRLGEIVAVYKKTSDDLELYKKRCKKLLPQKVLLNLPDAYLEWWMKKTKIVRNEKWVTAYDAYHAEASSMVEKRITKQYEYADMLRSEALRNAAVVEGYMEDDEEGDEGYQHLA